MTQNDIYIEFTNITIKDCIYIYTYMCVCVCAWDIYIQNQDKSMIESFAFFLY